MFWSFKGFRGIPLQCCLKTGCNNWWGTTHATLVYCGGGGTGACQLVVIILCKYLMWSMNWWKGLRVLLSLTEIILTMHKSIIHEKYVVFLIVLQTIANSVMFTKKRNCIIQITIECSFKIRFIWQKCDETWSKHPYLMRFSMLRELTLHLWLFCLGHQLVRERGYKSTFFSKNCYKEDPQYNVRSKY